MSRYGTRGRSMSGPRDRTEADQAPLPRDRTEADQAPLPRDRTQADQAPLTRGRTSVTSSDDPTIPCTSPPHTPNKQDMDSTSQLSVAPSYVTLSPEEKRWMVVSATADYHAMFSLLTANGRLAKFQDISNGYTALHWASKLGQPEVVKLLANRIGVNVNQQSHGGYTALHLAAMQGHTDIMELLLNVYKADPNIRDNGGRKARYYYLLRSASAVGSRAPPPLGYCHGDWHVILSPTQAYTAPCATHSIPSSSSNSSISGNSSSSSLHMPVTEGIDVVQDGEVLEAEDWVLL